MKCGREPGGSEVVIYGISPSYPDFGKHCASRQATLNGKETEGLFVKEIPNYNHCNFYHSAHHLLVKIAFGNSYYCRVKG